MNIASFQTFLAIVETGNLVRASERLNVTQSTVTARLKALEQALGQPLLVRQKSGATLTSAGLKFRRYAEVMTQLWQQAQQESSLPERVEFVCNIGCQIDLWHGLGQRMFDSIRDTTPAIGLSVWPGGAAKLAEWLDSGLIDIAITNQPPGTGDNVVTELPAETLILVSTVADAPMRFDPRYVYVEAGDAFGRQHAAAYADADTAKITLGSAQWALDHILAVGGTAYLPERLAASDIAAGRLFRVQKAPQFSHPVYVVRRRSTTADWAWLDNMIDRLAHGQPPVA